MHFVTDYNAICEMVNDWETFRTEGSSVPMETVFGKDALSLLDGEAHFRERTNLNPAFSPKVFPFYFDIIRRRASEKLAGMAKESADGNTVLLDPAFRDLYLAVTVEMTTGITSDESYYSRICELNRRLLLAFISPPYGPIFDDAIKARIELNGIISDVIQRAVKEKADIIEKLRMYGDEIFSLGSKEIGTTEVNVLLMLLAANKKIRIGVDNDPAVFRRLADLIIGLWIGGYSTSAPTSSCAIFEMLRDAELWEELRSEQENIINEHGGVGDVTYSQLSKMNKLESVIDECLRLHPVLYGIARKCTRDVEVFGRRIEKGALVWFDWAMAMLDDEYYADAEVFQWDRFLKQEGKPSVPKVLTFGPPGVPHYCIGSQFAYMLMKTTFAEILRGYTLKLDPAASTEYARVPENIPASKVAIAEIEARDVR